MNKQPRFKYKVDKLGRLQYWWNCPSCNMTIGQRDLECKWCSATVRDQSEVMHAERQLLVAQEWYDSL